MFPSGLYLYIGYNEYNRVFKLDENLKFKQSFPLTDEPGEIKISNNVTSVAFFFESAICFFDIETFKEFKRHFSYETLAVTSTGFMVYDDNSNKFFFYNYDGELTGDKVYKLFRCISTPLSCLQSKNQENSIVSQ